MRNALGDFEAVSNEGAGERDLYVALCVDLDGTLISSDVLYESLVKLVATQPLKLFGAVGSVSGGKARLKSYLTKHVDLQIPLLPFREEVVRYVQEERARGRKTVLVTASHQSLADQIAAHLGIFDEVYGTSDGHNLKGINKASFLKERFSEFEYIGDSLADEPVWRQAARVSVVAGSRGVESMARAIDNNARVFSGGFSLRVLPKMLRVHQWVKNLLLFLPLLMAHKIGDLSLFLDACIAFLLFSMTASSVYLLNDLVDLENDRQHPTKCRRPLAAGKVTPQVAMLTVFGLLAMTAICATLLPVPFVSTLLCYFMITTLYSLYLKKLPILDIITLASLYTIRIIAGGSATGVPVSEWLLAFSLFMFFSLACVKRFSELLGVQDRKESHARGRGYRAGDIEQIAMFGSVSGYLSVLILALYINSPAVVELYQYPRALWLLCLTVLYWVTRVWLLTRRGEVHEDPIVFALRDRA
ncbi:MAG: UbiA family prenyltransferase, partial [Bdellovibrionales bacterium]|nr:UbiA family prenyltransferase [Bdellovibrionales bacterium]